MPRPAWIGSLTPVVCGLAAAIVTAIIAVVLVGLSPMALTLALAGGVLGAWLGVLIRGLQCPQCGSKDVRKSVRWLWERPLAITLLRPYRCQGCYTRFWGPI
ncbi:MAG: hypothetical protein HYT78_20845 [Deltaproteobacteria bacterium]|nr:hypothetical protein [Deltaproteobacteria bacterium]